MNLSLTLQQIEREGYSIELFVPDAQQVQQRYYQQKQEDTNAPFPHWAKLWPAALALGDFLHHHPHLITGKTVLELAAGLGFPSLFAAAHARQVCCSDYLPEATEVIARSAAHLALTNFECLLLNWYQLPDNLQAEVVLLSDINYDPAAFTQLYGVLTRFITSGTTIILSTPQRLMAKPFIEQLLPWCTTHEIADIHYNNQSEPISILVLTKQA